MKYETGSFGGRKCTDLPQKLKSHLKKAILRIIVMEPNNQCTQTSWYD